MDINQKIKDLRKSKKLSQKDLATIIGVAQPTINYFESRGKDLTINQLESIATGLGVSVKELLFDEKEEKIDANVALLDLQRQNELLRMELEIYKLKEENLKIQKYVSTTVIDNFSEFSNIIVEANIEFNEEQKARIKAIENNLKEFLEKMSVK